MTLYGTSGAFTTVGTWATEASTWYATIPSYITPANLIETGQGDTPVRQGTTGIIVVDKNSSKNCQVTSREEDKGIQGTYDIMLAGYNFFDWLLENCPEEFIEGLQLCLENRLEKKSEDENAQR